MCVPVCMYVKCEHMCVLQHVLTHVYACWYPGRPEVCHPPELGLQAVVNCPSWVLGTELGSSWRAGHPLELLRATRLASPEKHGFHD